MEGLIGENDLEMVEKTSEHFAISITDQVVETIDINDPNNPIAMQYVPTVHELNIVDAELDDPIGDYVHSPVKGIVHRYPDRCLLKIVNICSVYCRFCFRRELIGPGSEFLSTQETEDALDYIRSRSEIWEVILTGGDPLVMTGPSLQKILKKLDEIEHVKVIRFHTRIPMVKSENITEEFVNFCKSLRSTIYLVVHTNHAKEFTPTACAALSRLADAGIPLLSQSVLLKGINDSVEAIRDLMKTLVINRVKPYYLHHGDYAKGTGHFRTSIKTGQELMHYLRANHSGLCVPTYVLDIPGGKGKVPIDHCYLTDISEENSTEEKWLVQGHKNEKINYPLI